jgi:16S rRNA (guanine527-N7)-methyltransferase
MPATSTVNAPAAATDAIVQRSNPHTTELERRIGTLLDRYGLLPDLGERLMRLVELVSGDPLAPTTVRDPAKVLDDHLADSLVALELTEVQAAATIADLGAGAGFPGIPLAIALPGAEVALVESSTRKCAFMGRAIALTGARNARVFHARAESWAEGLRGFDLVTARALASLDVVAEYAAPLLRVGGTFVAWRGRRDLEAEAAAVAAASCLGLEVHQPLPVVPYRGAEHRHLHLMSKLRETPERFPRRPGVARKRPLGSEMTASDRVRR